MGCLHGLTKVLYGRRVERTGPIWPPDELIGDDLDVDSITSVPSAGALFGSDLGSEFAPDRDPIEPVFLDAGGPPEHSNPPASRVLADHEAVAARVLADHDNNDDLRLTAADWLFDASADGLGDTSDDDFGVGLGREAVRDGATASSAAVPEVGAPPVAVPVSNSPWAAPPRRVVDRAARENSQAAPIVLEADVKVDAERVDETAQPSGPAPGVFDVPDTRDALSIRQVTVVCRNENAGRAVSRLLTITLQHSDPAAWDRAAGTIRAEADFAHAGDLLARDQALTVIDAGRDVRSASWQRAVDVADQLIVAVSAAGTGPAEAVALFDALARTRHAETARRAVTVVLLPVSRLGLTRGHEDVAAIRGHFTGRCRAVFLAPFDLRATLASRNVWREIASVVRAGLPDREDR